VAISLDFQIDQDVLEDDRASAAAADPAVVETTYFVVPVRFAVDGRDVLRMPDGTWLRQPMVGFSTELASSVEELRVRGSSECTAADAGTLRLRLLDGTVRIECSLTGLVLEAPITELEEAIWTFREKVKTVLLAFAPEITRHPSWAKWFPSR